jgi:nucleoside-diphosphate-sugar epimerase
MVDLSGNSGVINIASGSSIMIKDLVYMIAKLMNYKKEIKFGPPRQGEVQTHTADITKAKYLGFKTKYTLEEGLKETIQWYRKEVIK